MAKPALGRGLGALLGGSPIAKPGGPAPASNHVSSTPAATPTESRDWVRSVPLSQIHPCPFQPRKHFEPETLKELSDSIREQGIVQPLVVRERNGHWELIAGERRWRAAQMAGLTEAPIIVRKADDREALELALIENLQRENLNPIEEAQGYVQLAEQFHLTQEQIASKVGKSRVAITNAVRLLKLPPPVQSYVREGRLSAGHAKVILTLLGEQQQKAAADRILSDSLSVRQTEELVARLQPRHTGPTTLGFAPPASGATKDTHVADLENRLRERLGTKVALRYAGGKGALEISFFSDNDLDRILEILGVRD